MDIVRLFWEFRGEKGCHLRLEVSLQKRLRDFTLSVDFSVEDEVFALLGTSGCGKSMTLRCIAGLEKPDAGRIVLDGRVLFDSKTGINLPPQDRHIGYLFQNYALFPNMTVADNIVFALEGTREEKGRILAENIARFHLEGLEAAYPAALSGGQQQRVAFARILATGAKLLLLDEPFSALDSHLKWQLELMVMDVLSSLGGTAILVSHARNEAYRMAERIAVMDRGTLQTVAGKKEVFRHPATLSGAFLTGCKNVSVVTREGEALTATDWGLTLELQGMEVPRDLRYVGIRAHDLSLVEGAGRNTFEVEVVRAIEDVFSYRILLRPVGSGAKPLLWEGAKDVWQEAAVRPRLFIHVPLDRLLWLGR